MKTPNTALSIRIAAALAGVTALAACAEQPAPPAEAGAEAPAWTVPPRVDAARREGQAVVLTGTAQPGGRVVMRARDGTAHAVTADGQGRFSLRIAAAGDLFLSPESQAGQEGLPGPDLVVIPSDGPAVALSAGAPSRRLNAAAGLTALDSDGAMAVLSGRSTPGSRVAVRLAPDGAVLETPAGPDGRWSVRVATGRLGEAVEVNGERSQLPAATPPQQGVTRTDDGWLIAWSAPDGARIVTWLPRDR